MRGFYFVKYIVNAMYVAPVLCVFQTAVAAIESNETLAAVGRMPVISGLILPSGSIFPNAAATGANEVTSDHAKVGVPLTLASLGLELATLVTDLDGDPEGGSQVEWLIDNTVVSTSSSYTPSVTDGGRQLSIRVTPKTLSGDPNTGDAMSSSNNILVRSTIIDRFIKPNIKGLGWHEAEAYCQQTVGGGYRLPSRAELAQLYQEVSNRSYSSQVCTRYGWPLGGDCGGSADDYWTHEPYGDGFHRVYNMYSGLAPSTNTNVGDTFPLHVACIR